MVSQVFNIVANVLTNLFLFFLVMGMAATVDIRDMRNQLRNTKAIGMGLFCQFGLLPFIGWCIIEIFKFPTHVGITLIIVLASPGGSYSNWWCSLLNADLALSVSMTTASTFLSLAFLPLNLFVYTLAAYSDEDNVLQSINFGGIFISLAVVIGAICTGVFCSWYCDTPRWHKVAYLGGNISGICLIVFSTALSFVGSGDDDTPTADEVAKGDSPINYFAIALPCVLGLIFATALSTMVKLPRPERLTTAVECCYQNTGIATSAALSLFAHDDKLLSEAMRVPVIYGFVEIIAIGGFLLVGWKFGWSKAPKNERFCKVITKSYELRSISPEDQDAEDVEGVTKPEDCEVGSKGQDEIVHLGSEETNITEDTAAANVDSIEDDNSNEEGKEANPIKPVTVELAPPEDLEGVVKPQDCEVGSEGPDGNVHLGSEETNIIEDTAAANVDSIEGDNSQEEGIEASSIESVAVELASPKDLEGVAKPEDCEVGSKGPDEKVYLGSEETNITEDTAAANVDSIEDDNSKKEEKKLVRSSQ